MSQKIEVLYEATEDRETEKYTSEDGEHVVAREDGPTPNGNELNGKWVYRKCGVWVDFDKYRHDLAERNSLALVHTGD